MIPQMGQQSAQLARLSKQKPSDFCPIRLFFRTVLNAQKPFFKTICSIIFHDYPCPGFDFLNGDKECPNFNFAEIEWNWN